MYDYFRCMIFLLKKYFGIGIKNESHRDGWLKSRLEKISNGSKILDAGAGELKYKKYCGHLNYVSQDFGQYTGEGNKQGLQMKKWDNTKLDIVSDIISIPVADQSFDAIMCVEVLEHVPEPIRAIKEFSRILKPGGTLVITAPFCSLTHFAPYFFYTGYSKYWYEKFLKENGFTIQEVDYNGNFFDYLIQELKRLFRVTSDCSKLNFVFKLLLGIVAIIPLVVLLLLLKLLSIFNKDSESVLCFGLGIVAKKI